MRFSHAARLAQKVERRRHCQRCDDKRRSDSDLGNVLLPSGPIESSAQVKKHRLVNTGAGEACGYDLNTRQEEKRSGG
jgi:hypothetical protein